MKLVTFSEGTSASRIGALVDGGVIDLTAAGLPADMVELIALGARALERARRALDGAAPIPEHEAQLHAPMLPPKQ